MSMLDPRAIHLQGHDSLADIDYESLILNPRTLFIDGPLGGYEIKT